MKSKTLLAANILSTIFSLFLLGYFGYALVEAGGWDFIEAVEDSFEIITDIFREAMFVYIILILLLIHILSFVLGSMFGWIAYISKKSGLAKFAATLYLIATVSFPFFLICSLPTTIVGFIGAGKQKEINRKS